MTCAPLAIGAVAVLVLAGCTGGSMPAETLVATSAPTGAPEATAFAPEDAAEVECIDVASRAAQAHGERTFVDAGGATSTVVEAHAVAGGRVVTAAIDRADLVGYGTVAFLSQCGDGEATLLGGYVPEDGGMLLLFTTEAGSAAGDVPPVAP